MRLKSRILLIFKHLWDHTDEAHTVSLEQLKDHLQSCGLSRPDSRTIKADIDQLIELGVDIIIDRRVQNQYFIGTRHFDTAEVKLLIDAVQSSRFITPQKSKALIRKLGVFIEPQQKQLLKRQLYIDHRSKATNESVILIVDHLYTAIIERKKVTFQYFDYTPEKKKVHRHGGQLYTVSPYAMLWNNDQYYMVGYSEERKLVATYRVDRISQLTVTEEPARTRPADFTISDYFGQTFSMYLGEEAKVELLCENALMGSIIDRFGENVSVQIVDREHFKVTATVALSNNFYGWVFASGGKMRILGSEKAVEGFKAIMEKFVFVE